jgi:hypothetical protein
VLGVLYAVLVLCLSLNLYGYHFEGSTLYGFNLVLTVVVATVFAVFCVLAAGAIPRQWECRIDVSDRRVLQISQLTALLSLAVYCHLWIGSPLYTPAAAAVNLLSLLLVGLSTIRLPHTLVWSSAVVVIASANLMVAIHRIPFESIGGDMLAIVDSGITRLLDWQFPYVDLRIYGTEKLEYAGRPLTYLPLMWLSYVPFRLLGIDLRYLSVVSLVWTAALVVNTARLGPEDSVGRRLLPLVLAAFCLSPLTMMKLPDIQTPVFWLVLVAIGYCIAMARGPVIVGLLCGAAVTMRETSIVIMPLLAIYYFKRSSADLCWWVATVVATSALVLAPFVIVNWKAFWSSISYNALFVAGYAFERKVQLTHVGLGGQFLRIGHGEWAPVVQAAISGAAYVYALFRMNGRKHLLLLMGTVYFCFIVVNTVVFEYYYLEPLIILGLWLVHDERASSGPPPRCGQRSRPVKHSQQVCLGLCGRAQRRPFFVPVVSIRTSSS